MEKVKWGILGTANIAKNSTIPGMKQAECCEVYAIAGRDLQKAQDFQKEFGIEQAFGSYEGLLEDPAIEAVYIPLPNNLHLKWVKAALEAGKHVLCEKPLALSAEEARDMFETARKNNRLLMEAYAYLHSPYIRRLKNDVKSGVIGDVNYIESAFYTQGYKEDFRLHKELGGGAMYDLGCYCTTMILSLIDSEPDFIKADAEFSDLGVDLMTGAIIRFKNGARAAFNVGMILGEESNFRFDRLYIHGSKGSIRSDVEYNREGDVGYKIYTTDEGIIERRIHVPQNYALEIEQFSRCILFGEEPNITPEFSIRNSELMDKILERIGYFF